MAKRLDFTKSSGSQLKVTEPLECTVIKATYYLIVVAKKDYFGYLFACI